MGEVAELTNVSPNNTKEFALDQEELRDAVMAWLDRTHRPAGVDDFRVIIWHTHPSGHIGPSEGDMEVKRQFEAAGFNIPYLVVSLPDGIATRF